MRGDEICSDSLFSYVDLEARIPSKCPLRAIRQLVDNLEAPPSGCPFHPRYPRAIAKCSTEMPPKKDLGTEDSAHMVRCHLF